jgi:tetratricopeptide (TPR) repeat protein
VAIDREESLKKAEKLLRQGRLDAAIAEYQGVVDRYPRDWNTVNALGDCYARAHMVEKACELYNQIGDHFAQEGFFSKAAALYKKSLKIQPGDERALGQAAEMAIRQGTLAEAKQYLQQLAERKQQRGQARAAAELLLRIGTLDPGDLEARLTGVTAAAKAGSGELVAGELLAIAEAHKAAGQDEKALAVLVEAARLVPADNDIRTALSRAYASRGELVAARSHARTADDFIALAEAATTRHEARAAVGFLDEAHRLAPGNRDVAIRLVRAHVAVGEIEQTEPLLEAIGDSDDRDVLFATGSVRARLGDFDTARAAFARLLSLDLSRAQAIVGEGVRLAASAPDAAMVHVEAAADILILHGDFAAAAAAFEGFVAAQPGNVPALLRLVEISVDGELEETTTRAQAMLVDAYLAEGSGAEARTIVEDLLARRPGDIAHLQRLRRALALTGESDVDDDLQAAMLEATSAVESEPLDLTERNAAEASATAPAPGEPTAAAGEQDPFRLGPIAIDLHDILGDGATADGDIDIDVDQAISELPDGAEVLPAGKAQKLEDVFDGLREEAAQKSGLPAAEQHYKVALAYRDMGMSHEAIKELQAAAASPRLRFEASSLLARLFLERGDRRNAIEWLERAAEAPAPTVEAGRNLLYELGDTLEASGESARALAIFLELQSDVADFRDVARRVDRLTRVQAGG